MRIGSFLTILLVVLAGSGFLLSDNFHAHQDLNIAKQQIEQTNREKEALQRQLNTANTQVAELNQKVEELGPQIQSLQDQVRLLKEENRTIKDHNTKLQQQISQLHALVPLGEYLTAVLSSPLSLAVFLPVIPISAFTTYVLVRSKKRVNQRKSQEARSTGVQRKIWAQLTEEEMKEVIKTRRGR
jgi:predicted RNase H-like nuclease (RuvC/YqgF family)